MIPRYLEVGYHQNCGGVVYMVFRDNGGARECECGASGAAVALYGEEVRKPATSSWILMTDDGVDYSGYGRALASGDKVVPLVME